jgi:hypothetical protein
LAEIDQWDYFHAIEAGAEEEDWTPVPRHPRAFVDGAGRMASDRQPLRAPGRGRAYAGGPVSMFGPGLRGGGRTYYGTQSATYAPQWNTVGREERIFSGARQRIFSAEGPPRRGVVSGLGQEVLLLITGARELGNERPTPCPTESAASPPPPRRICGDPATWIARGSSMLYWVLGEEQGPY